MSKKKSLLNDLVEMIRAEVISVRKLPVTSVEFKNGMQEICDEVGEKLSEKYELGSGDGQPRFIRITPSVRLTPLRKQASPKEVRLRKIPKNRLP